MVRIGTNYGANHKAFVDHLLPLVDLVEVIPEALAVKKDEYPVIPDATLHALAEIAGSKTIIVHGVGLSIGSYDSWNEDYF